MENEMGKREWEKMDPSVWTRMALGFFTVLESESEKARKAGRTQREAGLGDLPSGPGVSKNTFCYSNLP
jgi:hypothetical protein